MTETSGKIPLNIAKASPFLISVVCILVLLVKNDKWVLYFLISYILLAECMNHLEKMAFRKLLSDSQPWIRPNPPLTGCSLFDDCSGSGSKTFGFPSGHAQTTTFAAVFWSLYVCRHTDVTLAEKIVRITIAWILAGLVWYSRVSIGCHNWTQICGGIFFGLLFGVGSFFLIEKQLTI